MEARSKKQRIDLDWSLTFDQVQDLRKVMEVISNVLDCTSFCVKSTPRHCIEIDSIDAAKVCMVQVRMDASSTSGLDERTANFCVRSKVFLTCLSSSPSHYTLEISKLKTSTSIFLMCYEQFSNSHRYEVEMKTLNDDSVALDLPTLTYNYIVEMKLHMFRSIVKTALNLKSDLMNIQVLVPSRQAPEYENLVIFRVQMLGSDEASPSNIFVSKTEVGSNVIRTDEIEATQVDMKETLIKYDQMFSLSYIDMFLKSMDKHLIRMNLGMVDDEEEALPLVIDYPLGKDECYIRFVLAPRMPDA